MPSRPKHAIPLWHIKAPRIPKWLLPSRGKSTWLVSVQHDMCPNSKGLSAHGKKALSQRCRNLFILRTYLILILAEYKKVPQSRLVSRGPLTPRQMLTDARPKNSEPHTWFDEKPHSSARSFFPRNPPRARLAHSPTSLSLCVFRVTEKTRETTKLPSF